MGKMVAALGLAALIAAAIVPAARGLAATGTAAPPPTGWRMQKPNIPITTTMVVPNNDVTGSEIAALALKYVGYRYTLTGNSPALGFSCIGYVSYVYQSLGIPLPDELGNARAYAPPVAFRDLQPGDILWFANTVWPGLSHVAIYLGGGRIAHSAWFDRGVMVSSLRNDPIDGNYWMAHYVGASRPWGRAGSTAPSGTTALDALPTTVRAVPGAPAVLVTAPALHLRRWWSLRSPVRATVPRATPLNVLRRRGHWLRVMTPDGLMGWVASRRVARPQRAPSRPGRLGGGTPSWLRPEPVVRAASVPRYAADRAAGKSRPRGATVRRIPRAGVRRWTSIGRWERTTGLLRVHVRPRLGAAVMQLLGRGHRVRVVARGGGWKRVRLRGGAIGYVASRYVQ